MCVNVMIHVKLKNLPRSTSHFYTNWFQLENLATDLRLHFHFHARWRSNIVDYKPHRHTACRLMRKSPLRLHDKCMYIAGMCLGCLNCCEFKQASVHRYTDIHFSSQVCQLFWAIQFAYGCYLCKIFHQTAALGQDYTHSGM